MFFTNRLEACGLLCINQSEKKIHRQKLQDRVQVNGIFLGTFQSSECGSIEYTPCNHTNNKIRILKSSFEGCGETPLPAQSIQSARISLQSSEMGSPTPSPASECCSPPPFGSGGGGGGQPRLWEWGRGEPIRTDEGTVILVLQVQYNPSTLAGVAAFTCQDIETHRQLKKDFFIRMTSLTLLNLRYCGVPICRCEDLLQKVRGLEVDQRIAPFSPNETFFLFCDQL